MAKGHKVCPLCSTVTGPRSYKCKQCGHEFTIKHKNLPPATKEIINDIILTGNKTEFPLIYAPGNPNKKEPFCPFILKTNKEEDIIEWIKNMREHTFNSCGVETKYARTAIKYFLEYFFPMYKSDINGVNPEYTFAVKLLEENMQPYSREVLMGYT